MEQEKTVMIYRALVFLSILVVGAGVAAAGETATDVEAIKRTALMKTDGVVNMDPETYAGAFAADAVILPPGGPAIEGRSTILAWAEGWASTAGVEIEVDTTFDEIQVMGDWAFVRMTIGRTIRSPEQDPGVDVVKTIQIQRRQADGSWKIARDIWNSHRDSSAAAE